MRLFSLVVALCLIMPVESYASLVVAGCQPRARCEGCGCKGGPGYRGPNGKCVGFKNLEKICGSPPETRCVFENAPGTGGNRECVLGKTDEEKS